MTIDEFSAKKYGFYRGKVIKHEKDGFCKIWIPGVYPDDYKDKPEMLPLAEQAAPLLLGCQTERDGVGNGAYSYPDLNAIVWCFFQNGDQNFPVYFASTLGGMNPLNNFNSRTGFTSDEVKSATDNSMLKSLEDNLAQVQAAISEKSAGASRGQIQADSELQALYKKETELQTQLKEAQNAASSDDFPNTQLLSYYKASISISKDKDILIIQTNNFTDRQKNAVNQAQSALEKSENDYHEMESKLAELQDGQEKRALEAAMEDQKSAIAANSETLNAAKDDLQKLLTQGQIRIDKDGNIEILAYETLKLKVINSSLELEAPKIRLASSGNIELRAAGEIQGISAEQTIFTSGKRVILKGPIGYPIIAH